MQGLVTAPIDPLDRDHAVTDAMIADGASGLSTGMWRYEDLVVTREELAHAVLSTLFSKGWVLVAHPDDPRNP